MNDLAGRAAFVFAVNIVGGIRIAALETFGRPGAAEADGHRRTLPFRSVLDPRQPGELSFRPHGDCFRDRHGAFLFRAAFTRAAVPRRSPRRPFAPGDRSPLRRAMCSRELSSVSARRSICGALLQGAVSCSASPAVASAFARRARSPQRSRFLPIVAADERYRRRKNAAAPRLSVVVPVRNEAGNIAPLVAEIEKAASRLGAFEIIYVDDGSSDGTGEELRRLAEDRPGSDRSDMRSPAADRAAIRSGVRAARAPLVVTLDGDGQNDPAFIPAFVGDLRTGRGGLWSRAGSARRPQGNGIQEIPVAYRKQRAQGHFEG